MFTRRVDFLLVEMDSVYRLCRALEHVGMLIPFL